MVVNSPRDTHRGMSACFRCWKIASEQPTEVFTEMRQAFTSFIKVLTIPISRRCNNKGSLDSNHSPCIREKGRRHPNHLTQCKNRHYPGRQQGCPPRFNVTPSGSQGRRQRAMLVAIKPASHHPCDPCLSEARSQGAICGLECDSEQCGFLRETGENQPSSWRCRPPLWT